MKRKRAKEEEAESKYSCNQEWLSSSLYPKVNKFLWLTVDKRNEIEPNASCCTTITWQTCFGTTRMVQLIHTFKLIEFQKALRRKCANNLISSSSEVVLSYYLDLIMN